MVKRKLFTRPVHKQTLAERLSAEIEDMILSTELETGANLPSETDLAEQYGVSRSVARDATRILMAKGLVEVQHGRGVFVSDPRNNAFVEAFLLTLKRNGVNSWEIRQLEQQLYPQVIALAMAQASDEELQTLRGLGLAYLDTYLSFFSRWEEEAFLPELEQSQIMATLMERYRAFMETLIKVAHNMALELLLLPILLIHTTPDEDNKFISPPPHIEKDVHNFRRFLETLETRDVTQNHEIVKALMSISAENKEKMKNSPLENFPFINQLL